MEQIEFKRSVSGFNRTQVIAYIVEQNRKSSEIESKLRTEIEELQKQNEDLIIQKEQSDSQKEEQIKKLEQELLQLKTRVAELKDKESKYDSTIEHIGSAVLAAKSTADAILVDAKRKVRVVSCEFAAVTANVSSEILAINHELESLNSETERIVCDFNARVQKMEELLSQARSRLLNIKINPDTIELD